MAKCVNAVVCDNEAVLGETTCMNCGPWFRFGFGFGALDIADATCPCPVCLADVNHDVKFPQCSHRVCASCFRKIMFWDESRYHLNPVPFGCPSCPNGCENPIRGTQCDCYEYDAVKENWEAADPVNCAAWRDAECVSIDVSIETPDEDGAYGRAACPICRAKYNRDLHGSNTSTTLGRWSSIGKEDK